MKIAVAIFCVDGETSIKFTTTKPQAALGFLTKNDHEGSGVSVSIDVNDPDEVYRVLEALRPASWKKRDKEIKGGPK